MLLFIWLAYFGLGWVPQTFRKEICKASKHHMIIIKKVYNARMEKKSSTHTIDTA